MSEYLFIRPNISQNENSLLWFTFDSDSKCILGNGTIKSLDDVVELNASSKRPIVVLYPTDKIILKNIIFPGKLKKNPNMCLYMLEDELATDIENVAVKILSKKGNSYDIMVYTKNEIENIENKLTSLGEVVISIIPDVLCLPCHEQKSKNNFEHSQLVTQYKKIREQIVNSDLYKKLLKKDQKEKNVESESTSVDNNAKVQEATNESQITSEALEEQVSQAQTQKKDFNKQDSGNGVSDTNEKATYMLQINNTWLVRNGLYQGFAINEIWLETITDSFKEQEQQVVSLSSIPSSLSEICQENLCDSPYAVLADGALNSPVNFSQYKQKTEINVEFMRPWYKVIALFVVAIILAVVNLNYKIKSVSNETQAFKVQQRNLFKQITGRTENDPVFQLKQLISDNSPIGTYEGFVDLNKRLSPIILQNKDIELVSMQYEHSKKIFTIHFLAGINFDVKKFTSKYKQDFSAEVINSKPSRDKLLYTVQLRRIK